MSKKKNNNNTFNIINIMNINLYINVVGNILLKINVYFVKV